MLDFFLAPLAEWLYTRRKQRLALEQCRVRYAIRADLLRAKRTYEDAERTAQRNQQDWDLQAELDAELDKIVAEQTRAEIRSIEDVRFK